MTDKVLNSDVNMQLEEMWKEHREHVRRMLISLTRDIDLADDLLQDTYVRAMSGIDGYRGGDPKAWLAMIARNVFLMQLRRKYKTAERPFDDSVEPGCADTVGTTDHVAMMAVREALSSLDPALRTALLMKHYAGFSYEDIARRTGSPVGTAKWRVNSALKKLRESLGVAVAEVMKMKCIELKDGLLIEYVYGSLSEDQSKVIKQHLDMCPSCRQFVDEIAEVLRALDSVEFDWKLASIAEIAADGSHTTYCNLRVPVSTADAGGEPFFSGCPGDKVVYIAADGEEIGFERVTDDPESGWPRYRLFIPEHLFSRGYLDLTWVVRPDTYVSAAEDLGEGRLRLNGKLCIDKRMAYYMVVRLSQGAELLLAHPAPQEIRKREEGITVIYRGVLLPGESEDYKIEFRLAEPTSASQ